MGVFWYFKFLLSFQILLNKTVPLCSWQYERQFNTCRIPGVETGNKSSNFPCCQNHRDYFNVRNYFVKSKQPCGHALERDFHCVIAALQQIKLTICYFLWGILNLLRVCIPWRCHCLCSFPSQIPWCMSLTVATLWCITGAVITKCTSITEGNWWHLLNWKCKWSAVGNS